MRGSCRCLRPERSLPAPRSFTPHGRMDDLVQSEPAHCQGMKRYNEPIHLPSAADPLPPDQVQLAASAYLARFTGSSREHTQSDLRCYLRWCAERGLDPLAARRPDLEQYIRWMQETCRFKPSTISRRFSVAAGLYRRRVLTHAFL